MVTLIKYGALSGGEKYNVNVLSIDGLSTDTKPTVTYIEYGSDGREVGRMGIPNGSLYTEIDTGDTYMYDIDNTTWHKVSIGGGGGGTQGGIVLVGETTTALTDEATTNPITVDGQSYTAQPNDAVIYGSKEFLFDGTKWHEFGDLSGLASKDIGAMTGYAKAATGSAIATTDTLNQAIGKVEKRVEVNENNILLKANTSDVNSTTANLQEQIDNIVISSSAEAVVAPEVMQARGTYPTLNARISSMDMTINGGSETITTHYDNAYSMAIQQATVYKSTKIVIPSKATIKEIRYYVQALPVSGSQNYIFILTDTNVILDKIAFTPSATGWNTLSLNKSYQYESYIAISRGGIGYTYTFTETNDIYSKGLYESSQATYDVGQSMSFTHNVPDRYYEFGIEVDIVSQGIANSGYALDDNPSPKSIRLKETGYTLVGRWYEKEINDTPVACCNSAGASIMFKVKNGTKFTVDIEQIVHPLHPDYVMAVEPYIAYSIDGSDFTRVQIGTSGIDISLDTTDEHFVWIVVDGMCQSSGGANRTTGWSGVYIKSITSNGDMYKVAHKSKQILFIGDSIVEGINVLGSTSTSESNSNVKEFAFKTARKLNALPLMQGYGGTTTANGIQNERYSIVDYSTDSFLEIMEPDIIVIEYGYNDQNAGETSAEFTTYYTTLLDLLSSHYAGAVLFCLIPFKQSFASEIRAIAASRKNCYLIETADYDISYTDTAHPNEAGAEEIATRLSEDIIKIMSKNFFI